jgi:hypothetical protein
MRGEKKRDWHARVESSWTSAGLLITIAAITAAQSALAEPSLSSPLLFVDSYVATSQQGYPNNYRPYFTQASVDNEPRLNLVAAGGTVSEGQFSARLVGQFGDSVDRNYSAEPKEAVRYLQEGYLGWRFSERASLDAGVFSSHIGAEGWMSKDNLAYTRSFLAEFSPYYQSGARFTYRFDRGVTGEAFLLNGWQNISEGRHPAAGTRLVWEDGERAVASSTFLGGESGGTRAFHDLVFSRGFSSGAKIVASIDLGYQSAPDSRTGWWWGYTVVGRKPIGDTVSLTARGEFYSDPHQIIVASSTTASFSASGMSGGIDVRCGSGVFARAEARYLFSGDDVFATDTGTSKSETIYVLSLSFINTAV